MAASLGGLDALAFTGGIGEHSAEVRRRAVDGLGFLGAELDRDANEAAGEVAEISPPGSAAACFVVAAREDLEIARGIRQVLLKR
jgi:acetate kinase